MMTNKASALLSTVTNWRGPPESFGSEETSTVPVHVIPEQELDKLKQKTERLNQLGHVFADQHESSEEEDRETAKLASGLWAAEQEIEKLKAKQQSYAQTLGNKGAGVAAVRTQMARCRNGSPVDR